MYQCPVGHAAENLRGCADFVDVLLIILNLFVAEYFSAVLNKFVG
jgi:hypothetical protein